MAGNAAPRRSCENTGKMIKWKLEELAEELFACFAAKTSLQVKPDYSKLRQEKREKEKAVQGPVVQDQKGGNKK